MKILKTNKRIYTPMIISFILLFILLGIKPHSAAALDTTPPNLTISSPANGLHVKETSITIQGQVTDDTTTNPQDLIMEIDNSDTSQLIGSYHVSGQPDTISIDTNGNWSFTGTFQEGVQNLQVKATDLASPANTQTKTRTFTVDLTRPFVSVASQPNEDMTHVDVTNSFVNVVISDGSNLISQLNVNDPVVVATDSGNVVAGTSTFNMEQQTIVFTPTTPFSYKETYYVSINPDLTDDAGNKIFLRSWKFTTGSDPANVDDPHGNYNGNVNTCINCHSTHVAKGPDLEDPTKYQTKYPKEPQVENYCMACHDGTVAPVVEKFSKNHSHNFKLDPTSASNTDSCTGCHNPHLTWTDHNPNLLKDHYIYQHNNEQTTALIDSDEQSCSSCHGDETSEMQAASGVQYDVYTYRKSLSATGTGDMTLCISCHNGVKSKTNIKSFVEDPDSLHKITAVDGSSFKGAMPCSECHETHGSDNLLTLKDKLGHENSQAFDTGTETTWNAALERQFCTKCHNGSTVIFGVTGQLPNPATTGHETASTEACSTCHGGTSKSFIEAAHAPKIGTP